MTSPDEEIKISPLGHIAKFPKKKYDCGSSPFLDKTRLIFPDLSYAIKMSSEPMYMSSWKRAMFLIFVKYVYQCIVSCFQGGHTDIPQTFHPRLFLPDVRVE